MSSDTNGAVLAAILDALTLVQGQLDAVARGNARIETTQREIMGRLDTIDAGQAAVTDIVPILELILARSIEDRDLTRAQLATVASVAGFAHAAASGSPAPLPTDVADDPLLERFALAQPADKASTLRAIADWRRVAQSASPAELAETLVHQYRASPTDTRGTRTLRYQLAAITRTELEGRGVTPPEPPRSTRASDQSDAARAARSDALARAWRAGESAALYADPELAGALDLFTAAEGRGAGAAEEQLSADLARLHQVIGDRLAAGERPGLAEDAGLDRSQGRDAGARDR